MGQKVSRNWLGYMVIGTFLLFYCSGLSQSLMAAEKYEKLENWLKENSSEKAFQKWQEFIQWKQDQEKTALSISAGLISDSGGGALGLVRNPLEFFKGLVTVGVSVGRGIYPDALVFGFKSQMEVQKTGLKENISAMILSYERYLCKYLEIFGFYERFSNSYLHLNQRYEIGFGAKGEWNPTFDRKKWGEINRFRSLLDRVESYLAADLAVYEAIIMTFSLPKIKDASVIDTIRTKAEELFGIWEKNALKNNKNEFNWKERILSTLNKINNEKQFDGPTMADLSSCMEKLNDLNGAYEQLCQMKKGQEEVEITKEKLTTSISLGLSTALFYETDSSQADWQQTDSIMSAPNSFGLPPEQRFRLSFRPSLTLTPYSGLEIYLCWYFKLPLFSKIKKRSYVLFNDMGEIYYDLASQKTYLDVRYDGRLAIKYEPSLDWAAKLSVSFEYDFSYDAIPPYLDSSVIMATVMTRAEFIGMNAADVLASLKKDQSHGQAKLNIGISF